MTINCISCIREWSRHSQVRLLSGPLSNCSLGCLWTGTENGVPLERVWECCRPPLTAYRSYHSLIRADFPLPPIGALGFDHPTQNSSPPEMRLVVSRLLVPSGVHPSPPRVRLGNLALARDGIKLMVHVDLKLPFLFPLPLV
jgi:hypothetical protein